MSTSITVEKLLDLLAAASAVIVDGDAVVYPCVQVDEPSTDPDDEIFVLSWENSDGEYDYHFNGACDPSIVSESDGLISFSNYEGDFTVQLLSPTNIADQMLLESLDDTAEEGKREIVILEDGESFGGITGSIVSSITEDEHDDLCEGSSLSQLERDFEAVSISKLMAFARSISRLKKWDNGDGDEPSDGSDDSHRTLMALVDQSKVILQG